MTIVGDTSRFAAGYELDEHHGGEWLLGHFCYWIGGQQVGDYELGASLRDILFQLERIGMYAGRRDSRRFEQMPAVDVFRLLDAALFGDGAASVDIAIVDEEEWARHIILPAVDVFDQWKGFLIESSGSGRLVTAHLPTGRIEEQLLRRGECDEVLKQIRCHLGKLHERESVERPQRLPPPKPG